MMFLYLYNLQRHYLLWDLDSYSMLITIPYIWLVKNTAHITFNGYNINMMLKPVLSNIIDDVTLVIPTTGCFF